MTILDDLKVEQAKIEGKIKRECSIESFIEAASNAVGHFIVIRAKDISTYQRYYRIISPDHCHWEYSDATSLIEEEIRWFLSSPDHEYTVSIDFCP